MLCIQYPYSSSICSFLLLRTTSSGGRLSISAFTSSSTELLLFFRENLPVFSGLEMKKMREREAARKRPERRCHRSKVEWRRRRDEHSFFLSFHSFSLSISQLSSPSLYTAVAEMKRMESDKRKFSFYIRILLLGIRIIARFLEKNPFVSEPRLKSASSAKLIWLREEMKAFKWWTSETQNLRTRVKFKYLSAIIRTRGNTEAAGNINVKYNFLNIHWNSQYPLVCAHSIRM